MKKTGSASSSVREPSESESAPIAVPSPLSADQAPRLFTSATKAGNIAVAAMEVAATDDADSPSSARLRPPTKDSLEMQRVANENESHGRAPNSETL